MGKVTKDRVLRLLEEAKDRVNSVSFMFLPRRLESRVMTIENKLVDLFEDIRDIETED